MQNKTTETELSELLIYNVRVGCKKQVCQIISTYYTYSFHDDEKHERSVFNMGIDGTLLPHYPLHIIDTQADNRAPNLSISPVLPPEKTRRNAEL